ncbi:hypothetical protein HYT84_04980, partial [Candidatus Micrarchaeota archaeon]|nr:hypothetical protein [Candidatus Micrarchaeota archaeon]
ELNLSSDDAFALVVAQDEVRIRALHYAVRRANMKEIPKETRRANQDGTTSYMRPLPGKARLYPETDIPPIEITGEMIKRADKGESLEEKKEKLVGLLKNKDMAERVLKSRSLGLFEKLVEEGNDPMLVANTLENTLVSLRREGFELKDLEILHGLFAEYRKGKFVKAAIPEVVKGIVKTGKNIEEVVGENQLGRIAGKELEKIARENNYDVGKIMQKYRLRVEVSDLSKIKRNP